MSARERLADMIRTDRGDMNVYSQPEVEAALDAYRVEILTTAGVQYEDCPVCRAAQPVGGPCGNCAFKARMAAEAGGAA